MTENHPALGELKVKWEGKEYDAASLLIALHRTAAPLGLGNMADLARHSAALTRAEACDLLAAPRGQRVHPLNFDYLYGRPLKISTAADGTIQEDSRRLYDRDAGEGAFERCLAEAAAPLERSRR